VQAKTLGMNDQTRRSGRVSGVPRVGAVAPVLSDGVTGRRLVQVDPARVNFGARVAVDVLAAPFPTGRVTKT
jgi:hypothetical protein